MSTILSMGFLRANNTASPVFGNYGGLCSAAGEIADACRLNFARKLLVLAARCEQGLFLHACWTRLATGESATAWRTRTHKHLPLDPVKIRRAQKGFTRPHGNRSRLSTWFFQSTTLCSPSQHVRCAACGKRLVT